MTEKYDSYWDVYNNMMAAYKHVRNLARVVDKLLEGEVSVADDELARRVLDDVRADGYMWQGPQE